MADLFERLKQRKIVQWALAYVAAAFALIQVLDIVAQRFGWPAQTIRLFILVAAIGFFVTLVLAWYHGERGEQRVTRTEVAILVVLLAAGGIALWRFAPESARTAASPSLESVDPKSIAVLPFDNMSEDKENAYFANGMQDMILTKLAGVGDLKVISRTSTEKYKSHPENLAAIGRELGVASILEGSVQKAGNEVLINLQLIDASNDHHRWAQEYQRTLDNLFGVEGEVAETVAQALHVVLTRDERTALAIWPTQNARALDAYLRGLSLQLNPGADWTQPLDQFQKAVDLDPAFTLAWTEVVWERLRAFWFGFDATPANLDAAKGALDRATTLAADTPQVQRARAQYLYFAQRDFVGALEMMQHVQRGLPNDMRTWFFSALVDRRAGRWDDAADNLHKAQLLAPADQNIRLELARTAMAQRRFDTATALVETMPAGPTKRSGRDFQFFTALNLGGIEAGAALLSRLEAKGEPTYGLRAWQALLQRDFKVASSLYGEAIVRATAEPQYQSEYVIANLQTTISWQLAQAYCDKRAGAVSAADALYSSVRRSAQDALAAKPLNRNIEAAWHVTLAVANAGLGDREGAVAEAQRAVDLIPESNDRFEGPYWEDYLAQVYATNGDAAHAVPLLRHLMTTNGSNTTRALLNIDPVWDPIREDAAFKALLRQ